MHADLRAQRHTQHTYMGATSLRTDSSHESTLPRLLRSLLPHLVKLQLRAPCISWGAARLRKVGKGSSSEASSLTGAGMRSRTPAQLHVSYESLRWNDVARSPPSATRSLPSPNRKVSYEEANPSGFPGDHGAEKNSRSCCKSTKVPQIPVILHFRNRATPFGACCLHAYL